jgi:protein translocase SecG subunit
MHPLIAMFMVFAGAPAKATSAPVPTVTLNPQLFQNTAAPTIVNTSWGSQHLPFLYVVQILFIIAVIGLIGLMSIQTTKNEGLSGSIGGRMESTYKGRLGIEQHLARLTTGFAVAFMFLAILDFTITR